MEIYEVRVENAYSSIAFKFDDISEATNFMIKANKHSEDFVKVSMHIINVAKVPECEKGDFDGFISRITDNDAKS